MTPYHTKSLNLVFRCYQWIHLHSWEPVSESDVPELGMCAGGSAGLLHRAENPVTQDTEPSLLSADYGRCPQRT